MYPVAEPALQCALYFAYSHPHSPYAVVVLIFTLVRCRRVEDQEIFLRALSRFGGDLQRCLRQFEANYLPSTVASLNASVSCGNDSKTDDQEHNSTTSANLGNCAADHSDRTVSMTLEELPAVVKVPKLAKNTAFMECLPLLLTGHKSFPLTRLLQQLDKLYSYNSSAYIGRTSSHLGSRSGNRSSSSSSLSGHKHDHRGFAFAALSTELTPAEFCFDSTLEEDSASPSGRASPVATDSLDISHVHTGGGVGEKDSVSETTLTAARAAEEMATLGIVVDAPPAPTASAPTVFLQRKKCNLKFGNEHVGSSIEMVLQEELDSLVSCGAEHGLDILKGNISSVDAVVAKCMRVRKGIADQYLYRSMYAVQLHHCWKTLDRRSFLILRAEDLRMKQKETVQRVLNFIGVDTSSSSYENGSANVTVDANATAVTVDVDQLKDSIIQEDSTSSSSSSSFGSGSNLNSGAAEIGGINSPSMVMCTRGNCPDENSLAEAVDAVLLSRRTDTAEQQNALTTAVKLSNGDVNVNVSTRINNTTSAGGNTEGEDEGGIMKSGFVNNATSDLQNRITQIFPEFAATSGWRLHSDYPPLSDTLRSHLYETVFRHHEQLLKELLSAVPPADDVV